MKILIFSAGPFFTILLYFYNSHAISLDEAITGSKFDENISSIAEDFWIHRNESKSNNLLFQLNDFKIYEQMEYWNSNLENMTTENPELLESLEKMQEKTKHIDNLYEDMLACVNVSVKCPFYVVTIAQGILNHSLEKVNSVNEILKLFAMDPKAIIKYFNDNVKTSKLILN